MTNQLEPNQDTVLTHRTVLALAVPMIISNISVPIVGAVDTAVVGHLPGVHNIGAVALGALIFSFLYWGFGFLKMGITGYIAQAYGAGDDQSISLTMLRFMLFALAIGLIVVLFGRPLVDLALSLIDSSNAVESLAKEYSLIRIWSAPATLCIYVFTGIFVGLHNTRLALYLQLVLNLVNIALDLLFVPVFQWGVQGVAWATLIAEYSAAIFGFILLRKRLLLACQQIDRQQLIEITSLISMMKTNSNIFIRTICLVFSFAFFTAQSAKLGEVYLAVNTILMHLSTIMAYALDGFSHSIEALGGGAYGAKNRSRFIRAVKLTAFWISISALAASIVYALLGDSVLHLFSNSTEVISTASDYLLWMIIFPVVACASYHLDGLFIGTGFAKEMRNGMLVSTTSYVLLTLYLITVLQNHGLYLALFGFMIMRALTLLFYYPKILKSLG